MYVEGVKRSSNTIYVRGVEGYFILQQLQHASTYIAFDDMVGKP